MWNGACRIPAKPAGSRKTPTVATPWPPFARWEALATPDGSAILVLLNFHRFMQSAEIVQALVQQISAGKNRRTFVLILSPILAIPTELEKLMVVVEHELPDRAQLEEIARGVATQEGELPERDGLNTVLDARPGLTRFEAEGALNVAQVVMWPSLFL